MSDLNRLRKLAGVKQLNESENFDPNYAPEQNEDASNTSQAVSFLKQQIQSDTDYEMDQGYDPDEEGPTDLSIVLEQAISDITNGNYSEEWLDALGIKVYNATGGATGGYGDTDLTDEITQSLAELLGIELEESSGNDVSRLRELAGMQQEEQINEVRDTTNALHVMMDEGVLDPRQVADACLKYMSEDDVADMAHANEFPTSEDEIYGGNDYGDEDRDGYRPQD